MTMRMTVTVTLTLTVRVRGGVTVTETKTETVSLSTIKTHGYWEIQSWIMAMVSVTVKGPRDVMRVR